MQGGKFGGLLGVKRFLAGFVLEGAHRVLAGQFAGADLVFGGKLAPTAAAGVGRGGGKCFSVNDEVVVFVVDLAQSEDVVIEFKIEAKLFVELGGLFFQKLFAVFVDANFVAVERVQQLDFFSLALAVDAP